MAQLGHMKLFWSHWPGKDGAVGPFPVVFAGSSPEGAGSPARGDRSEVSPRLAGSILVNFG